MKKNNKFLDIFKNGCVIFSFVILALYLVAIAFSKDCPDLKWVCLFFIFSQILAAANLLLKSERLALFARLGLHFLSTAALYFVVIVLFGGYIKYGGQTLIAIMLFIVLYLIFAAIYAIISSAKRKKKNKKQKYESVFK